MKYIVRFDRPLVDSEVLDLEFESRADAAEAMMQFVTLETSLDPSTKFIDLDISETALTIHLSTGSIKAFPKGSH